MDFFHNPFSSKGAEAPDFINNGNFEIDWNSPLSRGLKHCFPLCGPSPLRTLGPYDGGMGTIEAATISQRAVHVGGVRALHSDGAALETRINFPVVGNVSGDFTVSCWGILESISTFARLVGGYDASEGHEWGLITDNGGRVRHQILGVGHTTNLGAQVPENVNTPTHIWLRFNDSADLIEGGINGIVNGTTGAQTGTPGAYTTIKVFNHFGGSSQPWIGTLWDCRVFDLWFNDSEIFNLWNPSTRWGPFKETGRRTFVFVPPAAVGVSIPLRRPALRQSLIQR